MLILRSHAVLAVTSLALLGLGPAASTAGASDPATQPRSSLDPSASRTDEASTAPAAEEAAPTSPTADSQPTQSSPGPPADTARTGARTLHRGLRGPDVRALQSLLRRLGFDTVVDGDFGPGTEADVRRYESRRGLRVDGRVPPRQAEAMRRRAGRQGADTPPPATPKSYAFGERSLRRGDRGEDVRALQEILGTLGFATGTDGDFGPATETQVRAYENQRGLIVDGVVAPRQARSMKRRAAAMPQQPAAVGRGGGVFPIRGTHNYGGPANRFGDDRGTHFHQGQDIFAASGTPLVAVTAGRVAYRQYQAGGAGNYIVIHGEDGTDYVFMHMLSPGSVAPGQSVRAGQEIGRVGCTGRCSGAHLHFEMWTAHWYDGGRPFDPLPSLRRWDS